MNDTTDLTLNRKFQDTEPVVSTLGVHTETDRWSYRQLVMTGNRKERLDKRTALMYDNSDNCCPCCGAEHQMPYPLYWLIYHSELCPECERAERERHDFLKHTWSYGGYPPIWWSKKPSRKDDPIPFRRLLRTWTKSVTRNRTAMAPVTDRETEFSLDYVLVSENLINLTTTIRPINSEEDFIR